MADQKGGPFSLSAWAKAVPEPFRIRSRTVSNPSGFIARVLNRSRTVHKWPKHRRVPCQIFPMKFLSASHQNLGFNARIIGATRGSDHVELAVKGDEVLYSPRVGGPRVVKCE